jgi:hypothetical protein
VLAGAVGDQRVAGLVMTSRPFLIAMISASLTRSLMVAPVAYGVMMASLSICSSVSSCCTLFR